MLYKPGPKARAEFRAFEKRGGPNILEIEPFDPLSTGFTLPGFESPKEPSPLAKALDERGLSNSTIMEILANVSEEVITAQIEYFDWRMAQKDKKISKSPAGFLARAILEDWKPPLGFVSQAERDRHAEAKRQADRQAAEERRRQREQEATEKAEKEAIDAYWKSLDPEAQAKLDKAARAAADPEKQAIYTGPLRKLGQSIWREDYIRLILEKSGKLPIEA